MAFRTTRQTALFKDHSIDADILQPLQKGTSLKFAEKKETVSGRVWLNVSFTPPAGVEIKGWVLQEHCEEAEEIRPELKIDGFVRTSLLLERQFNLIDTTAPWFVAADFVIARAIIETGETGLINAGQKIPRSNAVGPLQVSSDEWGAFLKNAGTFAKDFDPAESESDRDNPQQQVYSAIFRMHADAKAISKVKQQKGVGTDNDPFLPSYLDVLHAYLTNSPEAAVAIRDAELGGDKDKKIKEVLKGPLTDEQIRTLFTARSQFMGTAEAPKSLGEFVTATEATLNDALKRAYDLIKQHAPEELPQIKGGEAPWFDVAKAEEAKNISEEKDLDHILHYFDATNFHPHTREAWCGAFAAFCMKQSGNPVPADAAGAANWKAWGQGIPFQSDKIPHGAVIVLSPFEGTGSSGHVAFFVEEADDGEHVVLLGGNQHRAVNEKPFPKNKIVAARWLDVAPDIGTTTPSAADTDLPVALQQKIIDIAANSKVIRHSWIRQGVAPAGYIKGMALVFATVLSKLNAGDAAAKEMAKKNIGNTHADALAYYAQKFSDLGMNNDVDGVDTLRHLFVLLIGIGMAESSGRYWCGVDPHNPNRNIAASAEAGLFQTSFDACSNANSPLLPTLFAEFRKKNPPGFLNIFQEGVPKHDIENVGSGDAEVFQRLTKECPLFAAEFAALMFRVRRTHYGTIGEFLGELRPECDQMLHDVQNAVNGVIA
jgi:uncharacterized protein (TIGR02594 family)